MTFSLMDSSLRLVRALQDAGAVAEIMLLKKARLVRDVSVERPSGHSPVSSVWLPRLRAAICPAESHDTPALCVRIRSGAVMDQRTRMISLLFCLTSSRCMPNQSCPTS